MRLLYFSGVVPIRRSAGFSLMHRHLSRLRHHELLILTHEFPGSSPAQMPAPAVQFPERSRNYNRVANRIGSPCFWIEREASRLKRLARPHVQRFRPEIILTVWQTAYLVAASDLSKDLNVPLAVVYHDDFEYLIRRHPRVHRWVSSRLRDIHNATQARICVGPGMVEHLTTLFGPQPTDIVYPIPEDPIFSEPPVPRNTLNRPLRIGFFGELGGNYGPIHAVVDVLQEANAEFHFFSHSTGPERQKLACRPHVSDRGSTTARDLHEYFRSNIDITLIPQGFDPEHMLLRETCFPSKIPEACQIGLPLLVVGPPRGSAARWGRESLRNGAVVSSLERADLLRALQSFKDPNLYSGDLARVNSAATGQFSPDKLHQQFEGALHRALVRASVPTNAM